MLNYLFKIFFSTLFILLVHFLSVSLKPAILDYGDITLNLKGSLSLDNKVELQYRTNSKEEFDSLKSKKIDVSKFDDNTEIKIKNVDKIISLKLTFLEPIDNFNFNKLSIVGSNNLDLFFYDIISKDFDFIDSKNNVLKSSKSSSIEFDLKEYFYSEWSVFGFPINKYTYGLFIFLLFIGCWWILSVINTINKDIKESINKTKKI